MQRACLTLPYPTLLSIWTYFAPSAVPHPPYVPQVVEYDFHSDVWFCHPPLPRASFGGGHGFLAARQEMHIVSGADRYRMAPIDSVMVMHLDQLTDFQACMVG